MAGTDISTGGCHCGNVRYEAAGVDLGKVVSCNCSICQKRGSLLTFIPAGQFTLASGEDQLTDYQFNTKAIHHLFCRTCGIASFARGAMPDGTPMVALNIRCFDDVDLSTIRATPIDGRSF